MKRYCKLICELSGLIFTINLQAGNSENIYIWKFKSGPLISKPLIRDSIAYFGTTDSMLYALNLNNGTPIWQYKADINTSFAALKDSIVVFEAGNKLYALNAITGNLKWSFTNIPVNGEKQSITDYHHSSPVINDTIVIFCDHSGYINGVGVQSGTLIYQYLTDGKNPLRGTPAIQDSIVYIGDFQGNIYAVSLKDSVLIWKHTMQNVRSSYGAVVSEMVIKDGILYFGSQHDVFSPLNIITGDTAWTYIDPRATYLPSTPVFYENQVIIGTTIFANQIMCMDNDINHKLKWNFQAVDIFFTTPILNDSMLIMNTCNFNDGTSGHYYILNCKNGKLIRQMEFNNTNASIPVLYDSILLVGTNEGLWASNLNKILAGEGSNILYNSDNAQYTYNKNSGKKTIKLNILNTGNVCDSIFLNIYVTESIEKTAFTVSSKKLLGKLTSTTYMAVYTDSLEAGTYHISVTCKSQNEPSFEQTKNYVITIEEPVGINELNQHTNDLSIFPNPAIGSVVFQLKTEGKLMNEIRIFSIIGQQVFCKTIKDNEYAWNLTTENGEKLTKGEYICQVFTENEVFCKKLVIE